MKKVIFLLLAVLTVSGSYGQSKWHQKQNNYFVEQAAKEYNLSDDQKEDLKTTRLGMVMAFVNSNKSFKNGEITADEKKEKNRASSKAFNSYFSKLVGKPYKEVAPFLKRMREELKNLK